MSTEYEMRERMNEGGYIDRKRHSMHLDRDDDKDGVGTRIEEGYSPK